MFGAAAAAAAAPTYFLPPIGGWKSDLIHAEIGGYSTYLVGADSVLTRHFETIFQDDLIETMAAEMAFRYSLSLHTLVQQIPRNDFLNKHLAIAGTRVRDDAVSAVMGLPANIWKR